MLALSMMQKRMYFFVRNDHDHVIGGSGESSLSQIMSETDNTKSMYNDY